MNEVEDAAGNLGQPRIGGRKRVELVAVQDQQPDLVIVVNILVEDLDADSLALIELVEGLEEELGERTVGFRIDDEDLEDLRTVRDAVDYVYAKLEAG